MAGLTEKQKRFCDEYIISLNATQSAIKAGYSENTASEIGYENLRKPQIREYIDSKLKDLSLSKEETLKAISDIAKSSLNNYFVENEIEYTPKIEKHLSEIIKDIKCEIEDADKFIIRAKITDPKELESHNKQQDSRRREIIRLEIELERNPESKRLVPGEPRLIKVAQLDVAKLIKDKEAGRIKSVKHSEHGLNVELYSADSALANIAKIHGLYEKDNRQKTPDLNGLSLTINKTVTKDVHGRTGNKDNS